MKKKFISFALALALLVPGMGTVKAKADSVSQIYANGYNSVMKVQKMYNDYQHYPYVDFDFGIKCSRILPNDHRFQELINNARNSINQFPQQLKNQKNTFSSMLDKYQEPIYSLIIGSIEETLKHEINCINSSANWNDFSHNFCNIQGVIGTTRDLCRDIPIEYKRPYSEAIDPYQQRLLNAITKAVNKVCDGNSNSGIPYIKQVLNYLSNQEYFSQSIKNYIRNLSCKVNSYSKNLNTNYLSNEELTNRFNSEFNTTNWNVSPQSLQKFNNIWNALVGGTVSNYSINKNIFTSNGNLLLNVKDPMNIQKVWRNNKDNNWVGVENFDSIIAKFTVPYSSDMKTIAQTANYYVDGCLWCNAYDKLVYQRKDHKRYIRCKLVRNGDNINIYLMYLMKQISDDYNPQTGLGAYN